MGPNVKKLMIHKMSLDAVPANGGFQSAITFLMDPDRVKASARSASDWVSQAIAVVKTAPDNPWGDDDEAIAGEILRQIEERKTKQLDDHYDNCFYRARNPNAEPMD